MTYVRIEVNDDLHAKFKSKCALEKIDMQEKLIQLMDEYVKQKR